MFERSELTSLIRQAHPEVEADTPTQALAELGGVIDAIPYRWLYWPDLLKVHGAPFVDLYGVGGDGIGDRLSRIIGSRPPGRSLEEWKECVDSFNYFEIAHLFRRWGGTYDSLETSHLALAELLQEPWRARLQSSYPEFSPTVRALLPDGDVGVCIAVVQDIGDLEVPNGW
ncbi:hypothetical protein ACH41H_28740 [Streptomyces sp. NPDC020800]|uniref:hypothetical protein n=1 Tax=Streptomyces sp. NPDC020800 TaxID=3365092 RepID=UPI0037A20DEE